MRQRLHLHRATGTAPARAEQGTPRLEASRGPAGTREKAQSALTFPAIRGGAPATDYGVQAHPIKALAPVTMAVGPTTASHKGLQKTASIRNLGAEQHEQGKRQSNKQNVERACT